MSIFLGAIERDKAYLEYSVKGKKKRIFFKSTLDAMKFKDQLKKSMRTGFYRETYSDIKINSLV